MVLTVTNDVQKPDKTPGPAAAFVVIHHVHRVGIVSQLTEQRLERCFGRHQPRRRRLAELRAFRIDKTRAGKMPFGITGTAGQVHQDQIAGLKAREQVARLDHQRQAREVRHVRSPEHKREDCSAASLAAVAKGVQGFLDALRGFGEGLHGDFRKRSAALIRRHHHDHPTIIDQ